MIFAQILSGGDRNYGYLIACETSRQAAVIDPSPDPVPCFKKVQELGLTVAYLINTHAHGDHTGGNGFFLSHTQARLVTHKAASFGDIRVGEGDTLALGQLTLRFLHTPGHTPESMCVLVENHLVTGDTLFVGKVGGTNSRQAGEAEFASLTKLMQLPPETLVWPGHNYGVRPSSTIAEEKNSNPFILRLKDKEDFFWLKDHWADFKKEHGIA